MMFEEKGKQMKHKINTQMKMSDFYTLRYYLKKRRRREEAKYRLLNTHK